MSSCSKISATTSLQGSITTNNSDNNYGDEEDSNDSLLYQMEKKYLSDEENMEIPIFGTSPCKLANTRGLELLVLNNCEIKCIGDKTKFASFARSVCELDLGWNEISSWEVISTIMGNLPSLKALNLSHNPISPAIDIALPSCSTLETLILNGVNLPLPTIREFVSHLPALKELHLSENVIFAQLSDTDRKHETISESVSILHVNACNISCWSVVLSLLQCFPNVVRLYLADNDLESVEVECPVTRTQTKQWTKCIRSLSLNNCRINTWTAVDNLVHIGTLEELRLRHVPLLDDLSEEERFHLVVGRIPSLAVLNGSRITQEQRVVSERFFIRFYQTASEKPNRFHDLVNIHGVLEQLVKVDLTPQKFAQVVLRCDEIGYCAKIRLRLSNTVNCLMKNVSKITAIPIARMRVFYFDVSGFPTELRFPNQQLSSLHIEDNDEFHVQSKLVISPKK